MSVLHFITVRLIFFTVLFWIKFLVNQFPREGFHLVQHAPAGFPHEVLPNYGVEFLSINNLNITLCEISLLITTGAQKLEYFTKTVIFLPNS